jgi:hypothetical protein
MTYAPRRAEDDEHASPSAGEPTQFVKPTHDLRILPKKIAASSFHKRGKAR